LNDNAHPPIHPLKEYSGGGDEMRVYDLIARCFLACVGKDAVGEDSKLTIRYGCEDFTAKGFAIKQKNFLLIYTFQAVFENTIPDFGL